MCTYRMDFDLNYLLLYISTGIPAVIVGISVGVTKLKGYGTDDL